MEPLPLFFSTKSSTNLLIIAAFVSKFTSPKQIPSDRCRPIDHAPRSVRRWVVDFLCLSLLYSRDSLVRDEKRARPRGSVSWILERGYAVGWIVDVETAVETINLPG